MKRAVAVLWIGIIGLIILASVKVSLIMDRGTRSYRAYGPNEHSSGRSRMYRGMSNSHSPVQTNTVSRRRMRPGEVISALHAGEPIKAEVEVVSFGESIDYYDTHCEWSMEVEYKVIKPAEYAGCIFSYCYPFENPENEKLKVGNKSTMTIYTNMFINQPE